MNLPIPVTQKQLFDLLLNIAGKRPVFIWGSPGIGKTAICNQFGQALGLPVVSLLGSQLAPEDIIGVPKIINDKYSIFCPPRLLAKDYPFIVFLDELNACKHEVQKAFYSLIHEKKLGELELHPDSIIIGAGNKQQDNAIVKPLSSALINRLVHVELVVSASEWLEWAINNDLHEYVISYIKARPDHLTMPPPKTDEPFSSPRAWHMLSDCLKSYNGNLTSNTINILAHGCIYAQHAVNFCGFIKNVNSTYLLGNIISGKSKWPAKPEDRDSLYFLVGEFRQYLLKNIPEVNQNLTDNQKQIVVKTKSLIKDLANLSLEMAQILLADTGNDKDLPAWFMAELIRDLPRLVDKKKGS